MKSSAVDIPHGITMDHFFTGLAIIAGSFLLLSVSVILTAVCIVIGIIVMLSVKGIIIDPVSRRAKPYMNLFIFKAGSWQSIDGFERVVLNRTNESQTMNSRGSSTMIRTRTYDIFLEGNTGRMELDELKDYKKAKRALEKYAELLNLEAVDKIELIRNSISKRRK